MNNEEKVREIIRRYEEELCPYCGSKIDDEFCFKCDVPLDGWHEYFIDAIDQVVNEKEIKEGNPIVKFLNHSLEKHKRNMLYGKF